MEALVHREEGSGLLPRHPIVCIIDLVLLVIATRFLLTRGHAILTLLPLAIGCQYAISCIYHWLPYSRRLQTMDHLMIAVLITVTYIQYWICLMSVWSATWRCLIMLVLLGAIFQHRHARSEKTQERGALYFALAICGVMLTIVKWDLLPSFGWFLFLVVTVLYFLQYLVHATEKPDPLPGLFGHREVQHSILFVATCVHLTIAGMYLQ